MTNERQLPLGDRDETEVPRKGELPSEFVARMAGEPERRPHAAEVARPGDKGGRLAPPPLRERPILMSGPMVRAILDGRKTQTRRVVKPGPPPGYEMIPYRPALVVQEYGWRYGGCDYKRDDVERCPYGVPGDRLWVRETFAGTVSGGIDYRADAHDYGTDEEGRSLIRWRPSIFMPRKLSRLTLEVTEVRVQRLQEISEEDAKAEGVQMLPLSVGSGAWWTADVSAGLSFHRRTPQQAFEVAWSAINGKRAPWSSNPWVWAISFRRAA